MSLIINLFNRHKKCFCDFSRSTKSRLSETLGYVRFNILLTIVIVNIVNYYIVIINYKNILNIEIN